MDDSENAREERGITEDNSERMNTEEAIEFLEKLINLYLPCFKGTINKIIKLLKRGEINQKIIDKMEVKSTIPEPYPDDASLGGEFF